MDTQAARVGKKRPRDSSDLKEWMIHIYNVLGFDPTNPEEGVHLENARSKTLFFVFDGVRRQITSRQYVLYTGEDDFDGTIKKIWKSVREIRADVSFKYVGFWRASSWDNKLLILIDRDWARKKSTVESDGSPVAFEIVAMYAKGDVVTDPRAFYNDIKPFLNILEDVSEPPEIDTSVCSDLLRNERPHSLKLYEIAKSLWDVSFTKNVSVVAKSRFEVMIQIDSKLFSPLTRLQHVVEKEDWYKMAVFLSSEFNGKKSFLNKSEYEEAVRLVECGVLHFCLMTTIDDYEFDPEKKSVGVDIIPAFRFWKYGFYVLYVRKGTEIHRFFLCKHYPGDRLMFSYEPFTDSIKVFPLRGDERVRRKFFYIVPRETSESGVPVFSSLSDVNTQITERLMKEK